MRELTPPELNEQTKKVQEAMKSISGRFKPVVDDGVETETHIDLTEIKYPEGQSPSDAMQHPYKLCGVATHFGVVYLLHLDAKSGSPGTQQWWRVQYDTETSTPGIRHDLVTQQEVLERAATESSNALLVYAHADATSVDPVPLSKALEDFVKKDNLNFMEELQKDAVGWGNMEYDTMSDIPHGDWNAAPPDYDHDWNNISAKSYHRNDSNMSSATLTPNTEIEDGSAGVREMVEVNGGMDALTGVSRSSSATVEGDGQGSFMDVDATGMDVDGEARGKVDVVQSDEVMPDAGDELRVQHIEVAEKKGG